MTIEEVRARCREIADRYGYSLKVPVEVNGRLKSTLGRVKYRIRGKKCYPDKIEFSKDLLSRSDREVEETIAHEMAHYFVFLDTEKDHGHDMVWKTWAVKLGARPRATMKREEAGVPPLKYNYVVRCSKCGKIIGKYVRRSKVILHPEKYRSGCCKACLQVFKVK